MGKLVRFDKRGRLISAHNEKNERGQLLMFTGVRYERNTDNLDNSGSSAVKKRKSSKSSKSSKSRKRKND